MHLIFHCLRILFTEIIHWTIAVFESIQWHQRIEYLLGSHRVGFIRQRRRIVCVIGSRVNKSAVLLLIAHDETDQWVAVFHETLVFIWMNAEWRQRNENLCRTFNVLIILRAEAASWRLHVGQLFQRFIDNRMNCFRYFLIDILLCICKFFCALVIRRECLQRHSRHIRLRFVLIKRKPTVFELQWKYFFYNFFSRHICVSRHFIAHAVERNQSKDPAVDTLRT